MITIGRKEKIDLPNLGILGLTAKIDTGAYTSALHCHHILEEEMPDGSTRLRLELLDPYHPNYNNKVLVIKNFKKKKVRSSNGKTQTRYLVNLTVKFGESNFKTNFTLTNRSKMKYPILLGRKFLRNKFIVDVSKIFLLNSEN